MPTEVDLPLRTIADSSGRILRLEIDAFVIPPRHPDVKSEKTIAIIDTGAMRTIVPPHIIDYFEARLARGAIVELAPTVLTLADNTEREARRFELDFLLSAPANPARGRGAVQVRTDKHNRGEDPTECCELPLRLPPPAKPISSSAKHPIIIGMDILHRWKLVFDGPAKRFHLIVCRN